jgi:hypothetical protein
MCDDGVVLEALTREDFLRHVGTDFRVAGGAEVVDLRLVEVLDLGPKPQRLVKPGTRASAFSLRFRGPERAFLPQQVRTLAHPQLGTLGIFLVPIGRADDGFLYEAIFN